MALKAQRYYDKILKVLGPLFVGLVWSPWEISLEEE